MEISRIAQVVLQFYEDFFHPIVEWAGPFLLGALSVFGIESLPVGWQDYVIVYVVVFFAMTRFLRQAYFRLRDDAEGTEAGRSVFATGITFGTTDRLRALAHPVVLFGIDVVLSLLWPLFPLLYLIGAWRWGREYRRRIVPTILGWLAEIGKVVAAAAFFVLTNAAATALQ